MVGDFWNKSRAFSKKIKKNWCALSYEQIKNT